MPAWLESVVAELCSSNLACCVGLLCWRLIPELVISDLRSANTSARQVRVKPRFFWNGSGSWGAVNADFSSFDLPEANLDSTVVQRLLLSPINPPKSRSGWKTRSKHSSLARDGMV